MLKKICVLFNTSAHDVAIAEADDDTQESAQGIASVLKSTGYEVEVMGIALTEIDKIRTIQADLVFNLVEWSGQLCAAGVKVTHVLKEMKMPFTGSDEFGYDLSCDKVKMKQLMKDVGIPTPEWMIFDSNIKGVVKQFKYPVIVKPALEHCGIGVDQHSVVTSESAMRDRVADMISKYNQPILVEEYIAGRELHITILERNGRPWMLPPAEIVYEQKEGFWPILTYDAKWKNSGPEYDLSRMTLAELDFKILRELELVAIDAYDKLGGRDYPRLDIRLLGNIIYVLEINNNPGIDFDPESGIGASARAAGLTFETLLKHIVTNAYARFESAAQS